MEVDQRRIVKLEKERTHNVCLCSKLNIFSDIFVGSFN